MPIVSDAFIIPNRVVLGKVLLSLRKYHKYNSVQVSKICELTLTAYNRTENHNET